MKQKTYQGIIYFANGDSYIQEAITSANSVKKIIPQMPCWLFITKKPKPLPPFDEVVSLKPVLLKRADPLRQSFFNKIQAIQHSPFSKTLFLDTDTYVCSPLNSLFELLDRFELATAHAPIRISDPVNNLPDAFPEPNSGVILFKKNYRVKKLLKAWHTNFLNMHLQGNPIGDQGAFRQALYQSKVASTVLPPEYNCRFCYPTMLGSKVVILHGRCDNYEKLADEINQIEDKRAFRYHNSQLTWLHNFPK